MLFSKSWNIARAICKDSGSDLVRIDSKAEEDHFFSLINKDSKVAENGWAHVGGIKVGDGWAWREDFTQIYPGMKWYPGDPNNYGGRENCLGIGKQTDVGYVDISCSETEASFFCQKTDSSSERTGKSLVGASGSGKEDSQLCLAITEALNSAKETGLESSKTTQNIYNSRKFKTTTISITNNEYDY